MYNMICVTRCWAFNVWVSANQRIPLSVLAWNPHKGLAREISNETGRGQGKEGPRAEQKKAESRALGRTEQSTEIGGSRLPGPVDSEAGLANVRA